VDWLLGIVIIILSFVIPKQITPYQRLYVTGDPSLSYPRKSDIVPAWAAGLMAVVTPLLLAACFWIKLRSFHDLHHAALGLLEAFALNTLATESIKTAAGRLRPHFFADMSARDSRLSFPSGHSSNMFCGMTYAAFYLAGKFGVFRRADGAFWKVLILCLLWGTATLVAVSRTLDYHHNFDDILAGAFIGIVAAYFGYFLNFHPLSSKRSHLPKKRSEDSVVLYQDDADTIPLRPQSPGGFV
jgi:membrane-associated phospholipid phosphatase